MAIDIMAGQDQDRILTVDDDRNNLHIVNKFLTSLGWHVDCFDNGPAAIRVAEKIRYNLILIDIQMPDVDGFAVARAIRRGGASRAAPLLAFTALAEEQIRAHARDAGMDGHIAKPFTIDGLAAALAPWSRSAPPPEAIGRLESIFGPDEIMMMLRRLAGQLDEALSAPDDGGARRARAHKLAGISGTLGFPALSELMLAVSEGQDALWTDARIETRRVLAILSGLGDGNAGA